MPAVVSRVMSGALIRRRVLPLAAAALLVLPARAATEQHEPPAAPAGSEHTCGVGFGGSVKCWGTNFSGQLGDGTNVNRNTPVDVAGVTRGATAVVAGSEHTCAVIAGLVRCWGANFSGQLGDGTNVDRNVAVTVSGLSLPVITIALGGSHSCALSSAGGVKCWGANFSGQLGDGTNANRTKPVDVIGLSSGVTAIAAGSEHTCAVVAGSVKCWGANFSGQLGDGTNDDRNFPVNVAGLPVPTATIATGGSHSCALSGRGVVNCWGSNFSGQLGDGTGIDRNAAVEVVGLSAPSAAIAAGGSHSCALAATGAARCWGTNFSGQLGDGTRVNRNSPVDVAGLTRGIDAIAAGAEHTCALTTHGAMRCWGANVSGQLGDGTNITRDKPVDVSGLPAPRAWVRWRWL
jgi:alpha-tubulin suppressor-like RCC1 family protein